MAAGEGNAEAGQARRLPQLATCAHKEEPNQRPQGQHEAVFRPPIEERVPPMGDCPGQLNLLCSETLDSSMALDEARAGRKVSATSLLDSSPPPVMSYTDPALLQDDRVLANLLQNEFRSLPATPDYFSLLQTEIQPSMRKIVADWLLEVCQELHCQTQTFFLCLNYFDRFLALQSVTKGRLQLLGCACLLVAAKVNETCPMPGERLIYYSDNSITKQELQDMELLLLQVLHWELGAVTPLDYLDHLLPRLQLPPAQAQEVKTRACTALALAATEYTFSYLQPSLMAASAMVPLLRAFKARTLIRRALKVTQDDLDMCLRRFSEVLPEVVAQLQPVMQQDGSPAGAATNSANGQSSSAGNAAASTSGNELNDSFTIMVN